LRPVKDEAENSAVRLNRRYTVLAVATLALSLAGLTQNRDQDRYGYSKTSANAPPPEARIDINRATVEELLKVPGMTRSWAGRIVRFRPYRTKLDLVDKGIITAVVYDRIKDSIIAHRAPD
jgi:DNA uptake protein ComE-like DNA-binding protein